MRSLVRLLPVLALLAACQPAAEHPAALPAGAMLPAAASTALPAATIMAPAAPYLGYHRYRGTVGGQPVTVELTIDSTEAHPGKKLACTGSYYYGQGRAGQLGLSAAGTYQPRQPLRLQETDGDRPTGTWQATQPAGPLLAGTWHGPGGKQLPFALHEDYTDGRGRLAAVRYEVVGAEAKVPCRPEREADESSADYRARIANFDNRCSQQFLHLLGPDTLRPELRALQCPVPAVRRRQVRIAAREDDGCISHAAALAIDYNDHGLLAWNEVWEDDFITGARPEHGMSATVYDLRGGGVLSLAELLRPGADTLLQRLITQHVLHDDSPDAEAKPGMPVPTHAADLAPLPTELFSLEATGLTFGYRIEELAAFTEGGHLLCWVQVPWPELQPLLRPDSPVARMLRERGLWRGK